MPSTEKPAGFFTTFSIFDPNGTLKGNSHRAQKRNRRVFVCIPCHRRKLKCDKGQPCSRCSQSGSVSDCVYQPLLKAASVKRESTTPELIEEPSDSPPKQSGSRTQDRTKSGASRLDVGKFRVSGSTHWTKIACEFSEACPYVFGTDPQWDNRYRQIKGLSYLFPSFSSVNFPFSNTCPIPLSQHDIVNQLPSRPVVEALVMRYFQTCELTHRLFQPLLFWDELDAFWASGQPVADAWLAQLLMILAIGCHNASDHLISSTGRSQSQWIEVFLEGAQISFGRSPYMTLPNLTTVRTLSLMVLARMLEVVRGSTSNQIVSLMGFVTRLAMSMHLHQSSALFPAMSTFESELRKRIWITLQLLDVDVAMRAGTSLLCTDFDAEPPLNANESDFRRTNQGSWEVNTPFNEGVHVYTDGLFQVKLTQLIPLIAEIINTVNSPSQPLICYQTVLSWERRLQRKLKEAESVFCVPLHTRADRHRRITTQRQLIEVLVHRARVAIHLAFARSPYDEQFDSSYQVLTKSSLALLDIQELWTGIGLAHPVGSDSSRSSSPSSSSSEDQDALNSWLVDLCCDDFDAAMLCMILTMKQQTSGEGRPGDLLPQDIAWAVLQRGLVQFRNRACRSLQHFKQFMGIAIMTGALQSAAHPEAMLATMMQVADDVEQTVLMEKQDLIWMESSSSLLMPHSLDGGVSFLEMDPELLDLHIQ